jgi:hypothetical protein
MPEGVSIPLNAAFSVKALIMFKQFTVLDKKYCLDSIKNADSCSVIGADLVA